MPKSQFSRLRQLINSGALGSCYQRISHDWADFDAIQRLAWDYPGYDWQDYVDVYDLARRGWDACTAVTNEDRSALTGIPAVIFLPE